MPEGDSEPIDKDEPNGSYERKKTGSQLENVVFSPQEDDKNKEEIPPPSISFWAVYRYSDRVDYLLLAIGVILCMAQGGFNSVNSIIFRHLTDALIYGQAGWVVGNFDYDRFYKDAMYAIMQYVTYGLIVFTTGFLSMSCWHILCERQVHKIRLKFFQSVLHQNTEWFDVNKAGALTTKLSDGIDRVKDGIGDKTGITITFMVQFIGGITVSFVYSWKLSLVMLGILPGMLGIVAAIGLLSKKFIKIENESTSQAGSIAEEVVNGIRTVSSHQRTQPFE